MHHLPNLPSLTLTRFFDTLKGTQDSSHAWTSFQGIPTKKMQTSFVCSDSISDENQKLNKFIYANIFTDFASKNWTIIWNWQLHYPCCIDGSIIHRKLHLLTLQNHHHVVSIIITIIIVRHAMISLMMLITCQQPHGPIYTCNPNPVTILCPYCNIAVNAKGGVVAYWVRQLCFTPMARV